MKQEPDEPDDVFLQKIQRMKSIEQGQFDTNLHADKAHLEQ